jgi:hypothetical protein
MHHCNAASNQANNEECAWKNKIRTKIFLSHNIIYIEPARILYLEFQSAYTVLLIQEFVVTIFCKLNSRYSVPKVCPEKKVKQSWNFTDTYQSAVMPSSLVIALKTTALEWVHWSPWTPTVYSGKKTTKVCQILSYCILNNLNKYLVHLEKKIKWEATNSHSVSKVL